MDSQKNRTLNGKKSGYVILFVVFCLGCVLVGASKTSYAKESSELEDSIASLKAKIRSSETKNPKDIQQLYKFENALEKQRYLQKQSARPQ